MVCGTLRWGSGRCLSRTGPLLVWLEKEVGRRGAGEVDGSQADRTKEGGRCQAKRAMSRKVEKSKMQLVFIRNLVVQNCGVCAVLCNSFATPMVRALLSMGFPGKTGNSGFLFLLR